MPKIPRELDSQPTAADAPRPKEADTVDPLPLCESDLENLRASGLTDETIRSNELRTENGALLFPYRDLDGNLNGFRRRRPHEPRMIDGKLAKYEQDKGSPPRAYFPVASLDGLRGGESAVYITEGEKKALALSQLGLAAVGIGGVWSAWKKGTEELIDDLAALQRADVIVYIVFDYDAKVSTRRDVQAAKTRLAKALKAAGAAEVFNVELPPGRDGSKQGVDDYLMACGSEAFGKLVDQATPLEGGGGGGNPIIKIIPPRLGEEAYHGPIGEFLRSVSTHTEATDAGVIAHLLPALGVYIGAGPHVHDGSGTKQPARVNTVLVGPTSTGRKGTSLAPVDALMRRVNEKFWKEQRIGGLSTGEGLITKVADREVSNDKESKIVFVEKRLYVVEEEFSKVLAQLRREGNVLSQILRECFDSGNLAVLTRKDPLKAFGAHICISGHITPEELLDRFNHVEMANGFGNRFLWFAVKSGKLMPRCQPIPPEVYDGMARHVQAVGGLREIQVPLADASQREWEEVIYPALREDRPGMAGALTARGSAIVLRLALIYALLDPPQPGVSRVILPAHLHAAMAVWRYCEESARMLFKTKAGTLLADKILRLLASGPKSKDELNNHLSPHQKADAPGTLMDLEAAGLIRKTTRKPAGAGRPATVWELVR